MLAPARNPPSEQLAKALNVSLAFIHYANTAYKIFHQALSTVSQTHLFIIRSGNSNIVTVYWFN